MSNKPATRHCKSAPARWFQPSGWGRFAPDASRLNWWLTGFILAGLWWAVCRHLANHWESDPQYGFGWLVPPLAAYLAFRRWTTRPSPEAAAGRWATSALWLLAALVAPLWVIEQPNPDWRFISWALGIWVVLFTLIVCAKAGGWRWAAHFALGACLILTAIPWPSPLENPIVQGLMRAVAGVTVEMLNLFGIVAVQRGNLIHVGSGVIGVNEACSGVRSLQASVMAALFLGELCLLPGRRRLVLFAAALLSAIAGNVIRAFLLARAAAVSGIEAVSAWHDPAGYTILTGSFLVTWLIAQRLATADFPRASSSAPAHPLPLGLLAGLALWFAAVFAGTELWFRADRLEDFRWSIAEPGDAREGQAVTLSPEVIAMLRFDRDGSRMWREPDGRLWLAYYFEWRAGPARSRLLARMHRPDVCLTAVGYRLEADRGVLEGDAAGQRFPFQSYTFSAPGNRVYVYYFVSENRRASASAPTRDVSVRGASLETVFRRERNLGQQVLELVLSGYESAELADDAVRRRLPELIQPR
ncbi:MAG: hypothetical protein QOE70_6690 [Chthoniobacter sp.]|jgi:exosortase|nr:hypothetical protein [Chthoniobacter sp.]